MDVWGRRYKGHLIRSDYRVHQLVERKLTEATAERFKSRKLKIFDCAAGSGALALRIRDSLMKRGEIAEFTLNNFEYQISVSEFDYKSVSVDLNGNFSEFFEGKFDIVIATEIIEHLRDPWHFLLQIDKLLHEDSIVILSTPGSNSLLDRYTAVTIGAPFYFGERGYVNSGGHITVVEPWKMNIICNEVGLKVNELNSSIKIFKYIGVIAFFKLISFALLNLIFIRNFDFTAINVFILGKK
jgi:2-polyprenyl-3-methyl-5-hydroxy-6-metoxy-1,4-benzoquinol methylase